MSTELRVTFLGEHQDARQAAAGLKRLLDVVNAAAALHDHTGEPRWRFAHLGMGSIEAGIAPASPTRDGGRAAFTQIISGFSEAEDHEGVPRGWDEVLTKQAKDLIAEATSEGLLIRLMIDGVEKRTVRVTRAARRNLEAGLTTGYRDSIGSLIGQLDSATVHERREARLWPERGGPAVVLRFSADQIDLIRAHLGARVEARGRIRRNRFGRVSYMTLRNLDRLPTFEESPPLSGLIGLDPDFTEGKTVDEYLREIRGEAL